ncbi:MAG TPA: phage/plasmid primase, P4 family [Ktedonobacterales bacterium]|nr:phage/plasmid primase, P4 family [Ktedonobacterales bacterium]
MSVAPNGPAPRPRPLEIHALHYAARGLPVFPLRPRDKTPAISKAQGGHGFHDATTNEPVIRAWWKLRPHANIGIPTGAASGWVILDIDPRHGGSLEDLQARLRDRWPAQRSFSLTTQTARTGGGGWHLVFRHPGAGIIVPCVKPFQRLSAAGQLVADPAYDIKGDGGYIVAPPSVHPNGPRYTWLDRTPIADMPEWLIALLTPPDLPAPASSPAADETYDNALTTSGTTSGDYWLRKALARTGDGVGDTTGYWLAQQLLVNGIADARSLMIAYAHQATRNPADPFDEESVDRWLESAAGSALVRRGEPARPPRPRGKVVALHSHMHDYSQSARDYSQSARDFPPSSAHSHEEQTTAESAEIAQEEQESQEPPAGAEEHHTDLGNARRMVRQNGPNLRYVASWGQWLVWDGMRFRRDTTDAAVRMAKNTVVAVYAEAARLDDEHDRKELARWAMRSEAEPRLRAMLTLAQSEPGIAIASEHLDRDGWLLNARNGMVDLRRGTLRPHERKALCTKLADTDFDDRAGCPSWDAFLTRIFAGDEDMIGYVQRAVGYALTAETHEQVVFVLYGAGANGKSTFEDVLGRILGDYAMTTPMETFQTKQGQTIPSDVARLMGARFVAASESADGRRLDEELIKRISGGDRMSARFMHKDWFEFYPVLKLFLAVNHKPTIRGTDHGIWRRIQLWPFTVTIPKEEQDPDLKRKLLAEAPGILAWAVRGCLEWQRRGLAPPPGVINATVEYRAEMDVIGRFVEDRCIRNSERVASAKALYDAYTTWCESNGERAQSQTLFGRYLRDQDGIHKAKNAASLVIWRGIGLVESASREAPS